MTFVCKVYWYISTSTLWKIEEAWGSGGGGGRGGGQPSTFRRCESKCTDLQGLHVLVLESISFCFYFKASASSGISDHLATVMSNQVLYFLSEPVSTTLLPEQRNTLLPPLYGLSLEQPPIWPSRIFTPLLRHAVIQAEVNTTPE